MAGSGETVTFRQLEDAANRGAQLLRRCGLKKGDAFVLWSGNNPRFLEIAWTMNRTGAYLVPIASKLHAEEAAYIINDCGARVVILDAGLKYAGPLASQLRTLCPKVERRFAIRGSLPGVQRWEDALQDMPSDLIADPAAGLQMIYSSGTTGKPSGVRRPLSDQPFDAPLAFGRLMASRYQSRAGMKFVLSAPLYHSGSFGMATAMQSLGATILLFERFEPEAMLAAIDRYRPEQGQFVPTMFIRLLKLAPHVRSRYDTSSLRLAIHSAGPCPIETKRQMIEWWGPILEEIYGGTENVGSTMISSAEWLKKPGSVGRPVTGTLHICDERGQELLPNTTGIIYFDAGASFEYLNNPEKSRNAHHLLHPAWATFGDIGHVDEDGYLYLCDRRAFMIIVGGVNIYPQEAENLLAMHAAVADVAVFGIPDAEMGEQVKAVVQPAEGATAGPALEAELIAYCKSQLATLKCPVSIDFEATLPRDAAGKLAKAALRDRYWPQRRGVITTR
jgi:acyl-CoA synthetase (AMP-forming)/AMP-acid ligase II